MTTYVIGDIQGCYSPLQRLLDKLHFDPTHDQLWFAGDLVSRGRESLETLRFVRTLQQQGAALAVLGNHDISLIAAAHQIIPPHKSLHALLEAPDSSELIDWLRHLPLLHVDTRRQAILVHAGIPPVWDLATAIQCAQEAEQALRQDEPRAWLQQIYGDEPAHWRLQAAAIDRQRYTINALTRMRYCYADGKLEFAQKLDPIAVQQKQPELLPWFRVPQRQHIQETIYFGHWSTLNYRREANVVSLDSGCVWGNQLTAVDIDADPCAPAIQITCTDYERR